MTTDPPTPPRHYTRHGILHSLIAHTDHAAIYQCTKAGELRCYEVCRILHYKQDHTWPNGTITPAGTPYLPSSEQWGTHAWTYRTLPLALKRYKTLIQQNEH